MALATTASAQGPTTEERGMHQGRGRGHSIGRRLGRLAQELELNQAQIARIRAIFQEARPERREMRSLPRGPERQAARQALRNEVTTQIESVLTPDQVAKFRAMRARHAARSAERRERIEAMSPEERRQHRFERRERRGHRRGR
jgi:Spy/CpxP family protein refolding chaperone